MTVMISGIRAEGLGFRVLGSLGYGLQGQVSNFGSGLGH